MVIPISCIPYLPLKKLEKTCGLYSVLFNQNSELIMRQQDEGNRFVIVDQTTDKDKEIDNILLQKEKFWIGTLVTQHQGLNGKHDWNRKTRTEREKI